MTAVVTRTGRAIAVVGMSGRFPGARSLDEFWQNVRNGADALETFSPADMTKAGVDAATQAQAGWVPRGTRLPDADQFDATFFGYSAREAQIIDPQQRIFLECAWEAMEHAGYAGERERLTVGIYAGASMNSYVLRQLLTNRALLATVDPYQVMLGNDKDFLATRVSYKLNLHGPGITVQTACSTSLVAVQMASQALLRGECDMALAGGVSLTFPQGAGYQYQEGMIFSPDGVCRPFDASALGTRAGAGAGIVALKRLDDALADRDTIHAVILGSAVNNDGAGKAGYTAPSVDGQTEVIAMAHALAGVDARTISYVEAHGTGTPLGDPIEIAALTRVFRTSTTDTNFCALGSLKANLGHLDVAAGVAGLIKTILALKHQIIPPLAHFRTPNPQLRLDVSPFRVPVKAEPWPNSSTRRRAAISSFGIGGTNAHAVLEEAPEPAPCVSLRTHHLLVLSAKTAAALDAATQNLADHIDCSDNDQLAHVAHTLQIGRTTFSHRRAVVADRVEVARDLLRTPGRMMQGQHRGSARPVAFLFSGQGSQHAGMCRELFRTEPVFQAAVDQCAEILVPALGRDIRTLLASATDEEFAATHVAQVMLFVTEYALALLWKSWGVVPAAMLGHSIGEYVAALLAGVFTLGDALRVVEARGRLMQSMPTGSMLTVELGKAELELQLPDGLELAAVNGAKLCTVSGPTDAITRLTQTLEAKGVEYRRLHTSHAFHSAMMDGALEPFRNVLASVQLSEPRIPYVSNVTGTWIRADQATSAQYWVQQLRSPVLFADGLATLLTDRTTLLLEVGAGTALTSLARINLGKDGAERALASLPHPRENKGELEAMLGAAGRLWCHGVDIDWTAMHAHEALNRVPLPTYPFERQRHWVEASTQQPSESATLRHDNLDHWFYVPGWTPAQVPRSLMQPLRGTWLVFGNGNPLDCDVEARLRAHGARVIMVRDASHHVARSDEVLSVRAASDDDHAALIRSVIHREGSLAGVIHLWNAGATSNSADNVYEFHAIVSLSRALLVEAALQTVRVVIVTTGAQSVLGEAATAPRRALATGPGIVLPTEHSGADCSLLDIEVQGDDADGWSARMARLIVDEASIRSDAEQFVAVRQGLRWVRRFNSITLPPGDVSKMSLRDQGVVLITGGLGGIALTIGQWLAKNARARIALLTRSAFPAPSEWAAWISTHAPDDAISSRIQRIRAIEDAGGTVMILQADVADVDSVRRSVGAIERLWGPITAMLHTAAVVGEGLMSATSQEATDAALRSKVRGLDVLVEVLGTRTMDFVALFSSVNAIAGNPGSAAYTAACAFQDAFAVSTMRPNGWPVFSSAWSVWRDVGMATHEVVAPAFKAARMAVVAAGIRSDDGAEAFGRTMESGIPLLMVSPFAVDRALSERGRQRASRQQRDDTRMTPENPKSTEVISHSVSSVAGTDVGSIEHVLTLVWEDLLGATSIKAHDNFFELGGHSLMATRILARVDRDLGVRLPLRAIFEAPTVRELAALIEAQMSEAVSIASEPAGGREVFEL